MPASGLGDTNELPWERQLSNDGCLQLASTSVAKIFFKNSTWLTTVFKNWSDIYSTVGFAPLPKDIKQQQLLLNINDPKLVFLLLVWWTVYLKEAKSEASSSSCLSSLLLSSLTVILAEKFTSIISVLQEADLSFLMNSNMQTSGIMRSQDRIFVFYLFCKKL